MKAIIIGATGLTGRQLLLDLLDNPLLDEALSISRRSAEVSHPKLKELIIELSELKGHQDQIAGDHYFCCIGTTIKKAKTKENFRKIDYEAPLQLAQIAKAKGAKSFSIVSAQGANAKSPFFYNQVKGELEEKLKELNLNALLIYRPGLLLGEREEKRAGEDAASLISGLLSRFISPKKMARITTDSKVLAASMNQNFNKFTGVHVFNSKDIMAASRGS